MVNASATAAQRTPSALDHTLHACLRFQGYTGPLLDAGTVTMATERNHTEASGSEHVLSDERVFSGDSCTFSQSRFVN